MFGFCLRLILVNQTKNKFIILKKIFEGSFLFSSFENYNLIIQFIIFPSRQQKISAIDLAHSEGWQSGNAADC